MKDINDMNVTELREVLQQVRAWAEDENPVPLILGGELINQAARFQRLVDAAAVLRILDEQ